MSKRYDSSKFRLTPIRLDINHWLYECSTGFKLYCNRNGTPYKCGILTVQSVKAFLKRHTAEREKS